MDCIQGPITGLQICLQLFLLLSFSGPAKLTGAPHFIAPHFTALHRGWLWLALLWSSGTEPALSLRYACTHRPPDMPCSEPLHNSNIKPLVGTLLNVTHIPKLSSKPPPLWSHPSADFPNFECINSWFCICDASSSKWLSGQLSQSYTTPGRERCLSLSTTVANRQKLPSLDSHGHFFPYPPYRSRIVSRRSMWNYFTHYCQFMLGMSIKQEEGTTESVVGPTKKFSSLFFFKTFLHSIF